MFAETTSPGATPGSRTVAPGRHAIAPLPFDPTKLRGLSERLIVSHHDNNYAGAVKNLNKVEEELERVTRDTPPFLVSGLKERELTFTNSMILHEHYFATLGGDGRATGAALAGGSGWVILELNFHTGTLRSYWSGGHTQAPAFGQPLLVMDMYEHAYQMDYGAAAAKYIDAFFQNIRWEEVSRGYERGRSALQAIRG